MATDYGRTIDCADSIRTGRYVTGVRLVAQAVYHRLITERGSLRGGEDEANYGEDLTAMVGHMTSKALVESWRSRIRNEAMKDPRVEDAVATITDVSEGVSERYEVTVECRTSKGPFQLVLGVDDVDVNLLGLEAL
jgi:phage baseplate assembly protein W